MELMVEEENPILEIGDLEDRLDVMESLIEELRETTLKFQREIVNSTQILTQYIRLEDQILFGIMHISKQEVSESQEVEINKATDRFNVYGSDFQDTWDEEMWEIYNCIRSGFRHVHTNSGISAKIDEAVNFALTLAKPDYDSRDSKSIKTLVQVDEMTKTYRERTVETKQEEPNEHIAQKRCNCLMF